MQVGRQPVGPLGDLGVAEAAIALDDQVAVGDRGGHRVDDGRNGELGQRCHVRISSSVVVIVASSDSVLSIIAAPYSAGTPATASRGRATRYTALSAARRRGQIVR